MSIDQLLTRLADALEAQTAAMEKMMETGGGSKAAAKPAAKAAAKPAAKNAKADKKTSVEDAAKKVTAYLRRGDKDEREEAASNVQSIIDHYGSDRFTTIEDLDGALDMLNDFEEGRTPEALAGDAEEDEGGSLV